MLLGLVPLTAEAKQITFPKIFHVVHTAEIYKQFFLHNNTSCISNIL
jgi:hypothetical protein